MLPYATATEAEAALGRAMTWAEAAWFRYSAAMPDYCLYFHNVVILVVVYTLAPLPLALLELRAPAASLPYKLQPRVRLSPAAFLRCYMDTARILLPTVGPLALVSYPAVKMMGIRTGLPLPSAGETAAQLVVYLLVEDCLGYWIHRLLHTKWGYDKIHRVHHEFTAPIGFAAPYAHWAEVLIFGVPFFAGPAIVPCHMTIFWLWLVILHIEAIDTHSGLPEVVSFSKICHRRIPGANFVLHLMMGIRTGLPLPSAGETAAQLVVYLLVEDCLGYWIHRLLHTKWGYDKIHRVHHEFTAPIGFAALYAHWAEVLMFGVPFFAGPAIVPCHMTIFWLWFVILHIEAIDTHSGFNFPLNPTKFIPFYGGAGYHDYHHCVGGQSQSNFATVFTFCDYLYGTDKGYRYHKASLAKLKEMAGNNVEKGENSGLNSGKQD